MTAEVPATPPQGAALSPGPSPTGKAFALPKSKRVSGSFWMWTQITPFRAIVSVRVSAGRCFLQ